MKETFIQKHKVFLTGLAFAVTLALQEILSKGDDFSWKVVGWAVFIAVLTFTARNQRGQLATIAGALLTTSATYFVMQEKGNIQWSQLLLQGAVAFGLAFFSSPAKTVGYEHTPVIEKAKDDGAKLTEEINKS